MTTDFSVAGTYALRLTASESQLSSSDDVVVTVNESIANDPHGVNGSVGYSYDPVGNRLNRSSAIAPIILSSHLLHEVEQICNRVAIIDGGRLLYQGPVEDLIAKNHWIKLKVDRVEDAFKLLSRDPRLSLSRNGDQSLDVKMADEQIPLVNALLVQHGFHVMELSPQRESLEQVFLRLTHQAGTQHPRIV